MLNFKNLAKFFSLLCMFLICLPAQAGTYEGVVTSVFPYKAKIYVVVSGGVFGVNSNCAFGSSMIFATDPSTAMGKALLATALSAKLSGRVAFLGGDGVCVSGAPYIGSSGYESLLGIDLKG